MSHQVAKNLPVCGIGRSIIPFISQSIAIPILRIILFIQHQPDTQNNRQVSPVLMKVARDARTLCFSMAVCTDCLFVRNRLHTKLTQNFYPA